VANTVTEEMNVLQHGKSNVNARVQISCLLSQRAVPDLTHRPDPAGVT